MFGAQGCSKHVENWNKYVRKKEFCVKLVIYKNLLLLYTWNNCLFFTIEIDQIMFVLLAMFGRILFYILMKIHKHILGFLCACYRTGLLKLKKNARNIIYTCLRHYPLIFVVRNVHY